MSLAERDLGKDTPPVLSIPPAKIPDEEQVNIICENGSLITIRAAHNSLYCDPGSKCNGPVVVTLSKKQRGLTPVECMQCQEIVSLSATQALLVTRRLNRSAPLQLDPERCRALSNIYGISEEVLSAWGVTMTEEEIINFLAERTSR